jgi:2-phosphosulfolactate phosphatase
MDIYAQSQFEVRCEWGLAGVQHLSPGSDAVIIVDVLSFTTCVEIAVSRGAVIYPFQHDEASAARFAEEKRALLASRDRTARFSLSPQSLLTIDPETRLVLPSPNGSTLSLATGSVPTFAACLRNVRAVAHAAQQLGTRITVIPAGERWKHDGTLRPALEDWIGAGAVIVHLGGSKSLEAQAAQHTFATHQHDLSAALKHIASGIELIERGFERDVDLAVMLNVSHTVPRLIDGAYQGA